MSYRTCLAMTLLCLAGCSHAPDPWKDAKPGQKKILTTFTPLYCITAAVAGDDAMVLCAMTTQGPHGNDGAATDRLPFASADVIIANGLDLDDNFLTKMIDPLQRQAMKDKLVIVGALIPKTLLEHGACCHHDHKDHAHHHHHDEYDPHIWLGTETAVAMTEAIARELSRRDPANATGYRTRSEKLIEELKALQERVKLELQGKANKNLVAQHDSLTYFAKSFGVNVVGSIQVQPGVDPDAAKLAELAKLCREQNVRVIAIEPQYSKARAEALQNHLKSQHQIEVTLVEIDTIETAAPLAGSRNPDPATYLNAMRKNLDQLVKALP